MKYAAYGMCKFLSRPSPTPTLAPEAIVDMKRAPYGMREFLLSHMTASW